MRLHHWRGWKKGAAAPLTENEDSLGEQGEVGLTFFWRNDQPVFGKARGVTVLENQSIFLRSSGCKEGISRGSLTQNFYKLHSLGIRIPF